MEGGGGGAFKLNCFDERRDDDDDDDDAAARRVAGVVDALGDAAQFWHGFVGTPAPGDHSVALLEDAPKNAACFSGLTVLKRGLGRGFDAADAARDAATLAIFQSLALDACADDDGWLPEAAALYVLQRYVERSRGADAARMLLARCRAWVSAHEADGVPAAPAGGLAPNGCLALRGLELLVAGRGGARDGRAGVRECLRDLANDGAWTTSALIAAAKARSKSSKAIDDWAAECVDRCATPLSVSYSYERRKHEIHVEFSQDRPIRETVVVDVGPTAWHLVRVPSRARVNPNVSRREVFGGARPAPRSVRTDPAPRNYPRGAPRRGREFPNVPSENSGDEFRRRSSSAATRRGGATSRWRP